MQKLVTTVLSLIRCMHFKCSSVFVAKHYQNALLFCYYLFRHLFNTEPRFSHLKPIIREAMEKKGGELTKAEAVDLIERSMKLLFYRDARALNKVG